MNTDNRLPSDAPRNWHEAKSEAGDAANRVGEKATKLGERAVASVKDGYDRAKDAITEFDPAETAREAGRSIKEAGGAVVDSAERHPYAAFALGAASVGLVAWAIARGQRSSRWEPDYGPVRRLFDDYGGRDIVRSGESLLRRGGDYLRGTSEHARDYAREGNDYLRHSGDYAREGGRMIAERTEREPLAALLGVGIAVYLVGSLLTGSGKRSRND
jgi:hypothetical protein